MTVVAVSCDPGECAAHECVRESQSWFRTFVTAQLIS
jgi:hypothetical protein